MTELAAFLGDSRVGTLTRDRRGRLSFAYDDSWRIAPDAYPVSVSLPMAAREHSHAAIETFLWGLLPDNELILDRWAGRFGVSARNVFGLLEHVGEDCAGSVWFVSPERVASTRTSHARVDWLDESEIAERLRALRADNSAWRREDDRGQFSLGGAQAKTALLFDGNRWGVPSGRRPTSHILKPGMEELDGHAGNEHFCMVLAGQCGLPVATSRVVRFEDQVAIAIERYDRIRVGNSMVRVHQEDLCQALGVHPSRKYENDGGPGPRAIVELLRVYSAEPERDVQTFVRALIFAWLIGGTDAHAKNYSILLGAAGRVRLAPLYDLASALPYHELRLRKLKLAMKIGGKYRLHEIGPYAFGKLATELRLDADVVREQAREMAETLPDAAADVSRMLKRERVEPGSIAKLADRLAARARHCAIELSRAA